MVLLEILQFKVHVRAPMKCATPTDLVQVNILSLYILNYCRVILLFFKLRFFVSDILKCKCHVFTNLGCNVNGAAGDSSVQGTCPSSNEVCDADGSCSGEYFIIVHIKLL